MTDTSIEENIDVHIAGDDDVDEDEFFYNNNPIDSDHYDPEDDDPNMDLSDQVILFHIILNFDL